MTDSDSIPPVPGHLLDAISGRRSVRAFTDRPVPRRTVEAILEAARWAPSGANMQPWDVQVVVGETKARLTEAILEARRTGTPASADYQYYPVEWFEPYAGRRTDMGMSMYRAYRATPGNQGREANWNRNYDFFGAPVGLLFFIHRGLAAGSWIDYGMFIQNVMLAARAFGLETCPQASLADYPDVVRGLLGVGADRLLVCGVSLGWPDWTQPVNGFERARMPVADFTTFHD